MRLPPGYLEEIRARINFVDLVGRSVDWDLKKSNRGKGDMWAPCPFHSEKTASFHVDDLKGYFYCFGCHAKGDIFTFFQEMNNLSFIEAVSSLALEAGIEPPKQESMTEEKIDTLNLLHGVMEKAVDYFRTHLFSKTGLEALNYLEKRGLSNDIIKNFEIGYAPGNWQSLYNHLRGQNFTQQNLLDCGLCIKSDKTKELYDRFRNRVMFPIRNRRGKCIAFGGRALDKENGAKYINSPETILFRKGQSLYNLLAASRTARKDKKLIIAEGYMDVISITQANFPTVVAPLGTAITEDQLTMIWKLDSEPVVALDGDAAGLRAAYKLINVALPLLKTGRALRFALMPKGLDPDDLIRNEGTNAFKEVIDSAVPMVNLMWQESIEGKIFDSPERRALLDKTMAEKVSMIKEPTLRNHYKSSVREFRWSLFNGGKNKKKPANNKIAAFSKRVIMNTKASTIAVGSEKSAIYLREATIIAILINYPDVIEAFIDDLLSIEFSMPEFNSVIHLLASTKLSTKDEVTEKIKESLGEDMLRNVIRNNVIGVVPCLRENGNLEMAHHTISELIAKLKSQIGLSSELEQISKNTNGQIDETDIWRLGKAVEHKNRASLSDFGETMEYDMADNGARVNREERDELDNLLKNISFSKTKK